MKPKTSNNTNTLLVIAAAVLLGGIAWFSTRETESAPQQPRAQAETVTYQTLPPSNFTGRTREAYQAALDIPEVLKQVQCYCGCQESAGHQSNYFCFTDTHGAG